VEKKGKVKRKSKKVKDNKTPRKKKRIEIENK
jgi:hypothetical protein